MQPYQSRPRPWIVAALAGLQLVLTSCSTMTKPPRYTADELSRFGQIVTTLASPSMEGRGAGTVGLDKARDDLVKRFRAAGLQPAFVIDRHKSYMQPLQIRLGVQAKHQSIDVLSGDDAADVPAQAGQQFNTLGFSANGEFDGPLVFVGYGIVDDTHAYNSYSGLGADQLRGRVAVAFRYEPQDESGKSRWAGHDGAPGRWSDAANLRHKAQWAADHGAVALLVVNPPSQDDGHLKSTQHSVASETAPIPVLHISTAFFESVVRLTGRDPAKVISVYQQRADHGKGRPETLAPVTVRGHVELEHPRAMVANVAGLVPGHGALANQIVVVGAHYDHLGYGQIGSLSELQQIHPGADDNASGAAGLVVLARRFDQRYGHREPDTEDLDAGNHPPRRTVCFVAFSGEERGLLGSGHFVKNLNQLSVADGQVVAMLNFDMIGRVTGDRLHVIGVGSGDQWKDLLDDAGRGLDLNVHTNAQPFGGSDHMTFLARQIPAIHFFSGVHGDYHRVSDTADKINVKGALNTIDLADGVLDQLLVQPQRMAFVGTPLADPHTLLPGGDGSGSGRVFLGVVPDYATLDGDQGCGLSGIVPGSPAQAGGLRSDDVIVRWNNKPVTNVRGLTARLYESRPGDEVEIRVRRDEKTVTLKITLGQRRG